MRIRVRDRFLFVLMTGLLAASPSLAGGCLGVDTSAAPSTVCGGQLLTVSGSISNSCGAAMPVELSITIEGGKTSIVDKKKMVVSGGSSVNYTQSFNLPKNTSPGSYSLLVEARSGASDSASASSTVTVAACP